MKTKRQHLLATTFFCATAFAAIGGSVTAFAPTSAQAQDYTSGNLTGRVVTEENKPVAGATVTVKSDQGQVRTVATDADGRYQVTALPVGAYRVSISADGLAPVENARITVQPGGADFTTAMTAPGAVTSVEGVVVTARRPGAFNRTDTGLVVDVQDISERIPVGRSIAAVTLLTPGVGVPDSSINAGVRRNQSVVTVSGTSAAESVYYINGLNVTDQRTFLGYSDLPFDFIQTVDVKTGGYQAEFGRGTGGVINIVTRSGSNDLHYGASAFWSPNIWREQRGLTYSPGGNNSVGGLTYNEFAMADSNEQTYWVSGPAIKDHVFFFLLYNAREAESWSAASFSNTTTKNGSQVRTRSNDPRIAAKFDFVLNDRHRLEATIFSDKSTTDYSQYNVRKDTLRIGPDPTNPVLSNPDGSLLPYNQVAGGLNQIYKYTGAFTDWFNVSALYGQTVSNYKDYGPYISQPGIIDFGTTASSVTLGRQAGPFNQSGKDIRDTYRIDGDLYFKLAGSHHLRMGYDLEKLQTSAISAYSGGGLYFGYAQEDCPDGAGPDGCVELIDFRNVGNYAATQSAVYIQDSWRVLPNLTVQLGLRNDIYDYKNSGGISYIKSKKQYAPRLGFTWDPFDNGVDRVYGSFGDYYLPIATNTSLRASSGEIYTDTYFQTQRTAAGDLVISNGFPAIGAQIGDIDYLSPPGSPAPGAIAAKNLKPLYEREYVLGYEHTFGDGFWNGRLKDWKFGVQFTNRNLKSTIEDTQIGDAVVRYCLNQNIYHTVCNTDPDLAQGDFSDLFNFVLINPGSPATVVVDLQGDSRTDASGAANPLYNPQTITFTNAEMALRKARRQYTALAFTFERPFDGKWGLQGSYTWAHSRGNYEGAVKSDIAQTDVSITQDFDHEINGRMNYGDLPNDRRHTIKVFGNYRLLDRLTVGAAFTANSGRPYGCFGYYPRTPLEQEANPPAGYENLAPNSGTPGTWYCPTGAQIGTVTGTLRTQLLSANGLASNDPTVFPRLATQAYGRGRSHMGWTTQVDLNVAYDILKEGNERGALQATFDIFNLFDADAVTRVVEQGEVRTSASGLKNVPAPFYGKTRSYQSPRSMRVGLRYRF